LHSPFLVFCSASPAGIEHGRKAALPIDAVLQQVECWLRPRRHLPQQFSKVYFIRIPAEFTCSSSRTALSVALVMLQERIPAEPWKVLRPAGRPRWNRMDTQRFDLLAKIVTVFKKGALEGGGSAVL